MTGVVVPLPMQGRGGDVRNAPYPPLRAVEHLANQQHTRELDTNDGGEAA